MSLAELAKSTHSPLFKTETAKPTKAELLVLRHLDKVAINYSNARFPNDFYSQPRENIYHSTRAGLRDYHAAQGKPEELMRLEKQWGEDELTPIRILYEANKDKLTIPEDHSRMSSARRSLEATIASYSLTAAAGYAGGMKAADITPL
ncbi:MAG TPA: hypothetical protein VMR41_06525 [Patescibacteria group bacterium]|nr:hypothetical protein [Patescibacteria group bacterium]